MHILKYKKKQRKIKLISVYAIISGMKAKCLIKKGKYGEGMNEKINEGYSMDECSPRTKAFKSQKNHELLAAQPHYKPRKSFGFNYVCSLLYDRR